MLAELQAAFARTLLGADAPQAGRIGAGEGSRADARLAIYRNNVIGSLAGVLAAAFPLTQKLMGEENWLAMAADFIRTHPPREAHLLVYGGELPDFLAAGLSEGGRDPGFLPDLARLEWARVEAYHAADGDPVPPAVLAELPQDRLPDLKLVPHPSLRLVTSRWPVEAIWQAASAGEDVRPLLGAAGQALLVLRPVAKVETRRLSAGEFTFLHTLADGQTLGAAALAAFEAEAGFGLQDALVTHLAGGVFTGFTLAEETP